MAGRLRDAEAAKIAAERAAASVAAEKVSFECVVITAYSTRPSSVVVA